MSEKHDVYRTLKKMGISPVMARKNAMSNIIFPKFTEMGILKDMFGQCVKTNEQPQGELYSELEYRVIWRIYNGKLYNANGLLDVYCWSDDDFSSKATKAVPIGRESALGLLNLTDIIHRLDSYEDKVKVADLFCRLGMDLLLVDSKEEIRSVVEITEDLYKAGITTCIDQWEKKTDNGYNVTKLSVGDFLVMDHDNETVYCIKKEPFEATHDMLWK